MNNSFCPGCGTKVESSDTKFCTGCGYKFEDNNQAQVNNQNNNQSNMNPNYDINNNFTTSAGVKAYTNGMGIAGLVISIVSLILCCGSMSWLGLIFSIIGMNNAKKNNGIGKGVSLGGLIVNIVGLVLFLLFLFLFSVPFFAVLAEI